MLIVCYNMVTNDKGKLGEIPGRKAKGPERATAWQPVTEREKLIELDASLSRRDREAFSLSQRKSLGWAISR
jgi:hypothetical protein